MKSKSALLIIASSEADSNLYYASRFLVPDPVIYFETGGKKYLVLSDLEIDRAKLQASVHHILSLNDFVKKTNRKWRDLPAYARIVDAIFREKKIKNIVVPANFPSIYFQAFRRLGYSINIKPDPFFEKRLVKTEEEKRHILHTLQKVEKALRQAVILLQKSTIRGNRIYHGSKVVTSEMLQGIINTRLMEYGCIASHTIVASGVQGSYPHHEGHGPIHPHTPIIFDIFPRDSKSRYWGDMTRTMVKGRPSPMVKKMFDAVVGANRAGIECVKPGVSGKLVHQRVLDYLERKGFKTGRLNGSTQGFIHSTGHGLGLDIHELPSVSTAGGPLKAGHVITIEPGLYYRKHGGIRIEDVLYVTKNGHERLSHFPVFLEIDKI